MFRHVPAALALVWQSSRGQTVGLAMLTALAGVLPASAAYVGKLVIDSVVRATRPGASHGSRQVFIYVSLEALIVTALAAADRGLTVIQSLLRAIVGQRVNVLILEKAMTLSLTQFEDSEFHDKILRAQREASTRPLGLINRTFGLVRSGISLSACAALLVHFSPWAMLLLLVTAFPVFVVETKFSGEAFRLLRFRSPERRRQIYLETVIAREDYAKEVKLFGLAPKLLERYERTWERLYKEDRDLTVRRGAWGYLLGLVNTAGFYASYAWVAWAAVHSDISLGEMTMYLLVFKEGQQAVSSSLSAVGAMYEDSLYLSNLYEYLAEPVTSERGSVTEGTSPQDGLRFERVSFTYPGSDVPAVSGVSFHLRPGEKLALVGENGSGKTTLIKLLTRLYTPGEGRIVLDGVDLADWDGFALRSRIGVIFQDFVRYQLTVGENIGAGDVAAWSDEAKWRAAAEKGTSAPFIERLKGGYETQLGRWFSGGQELSGGQWQKVALSRAFMRTGAEILVLDEPTAAMDAEAEAEIFDHFGKTAREQMVILISHRFSTVRRADRIIVLSEGRVLEQGTHDELLSRGGRYATLFTLQAEGYR